MAWGFTAERCNYFLIFFETKPVATLLGSDIQAQHLTDDVLKRTLDPLYDADVSTLYQAIAEHVVEQLGLKPESVHLENTRFHVDGEYTHDEQTNVIQLVKGHSRDHRPDLGCRA